MITRSTRKDIIFGGLGSDDAIAAVELSKSLQDQIWRECHKRELCDATIYAFSLINGNPYLNKQSNTFMHYDKDMEIIKGIVEVQIQRVRQHKTSLTYDDLDESSLVLYHKFFYKAQGREKTPIITTPNVVHLPCSPWNSWYRNGE